MPKLRNDREEKNLQARAALSDYMTVRGYRTVAKGLITLCGFSDRTARNRVSSPDDLKISDLRRMKGLTDDQILRIVKGVKT